MYARVIKQGKVVVVFSKNIISVSLWWLVWVGQAINKSASPVSDKYKMEK